MFAMLLSASFVEASTHHSVFNNFRISQSSSYSSQKFENWSITASEVHRMDYYSVVSIDADGNPLYLDQTIPETYVVQVQGGGTICFSGSDGIKSLEVNYSSVEKGEPVEFTVSVTHNGKTVTTRHEDPAEGNFIDKDTPIAQKKTFTFDGIDGEFGITVTNSKSSTWYNDILFWDFSWEDCGDDGTVEAGDDSLAWSQKSGIYLPGTVVMASGPAGSGLRLYDNGTLAGEKEPLSGVIPTLYTTVDDNILHRLTAVSTLNGINTESHHNFRAAGSGAVPELSLSLPEGTYNPGTAFVVSGVPGQALEVAFHGSVSGEMQAVSLPSVDGTAPCDILYLPGRMDETVTVTLSAEDGTTVSRRYQLNATWIPVDAAMSVDFRSPGGLYISGGGALSQISPCPVTVDGLKIGNSPDSPLWVVFSRATLVEEDGACCMKMEPNSTMTIGTTYEEGHVEMDLRKIRINQKETDLRLQPGTLAQENGCWIHSWNSPNLAPAAKSVPSNRSVDFTATGNVSLIGFETMHHVITGVEDVETDSSFNGAFFDLQGRCLRQPPLSGMFIELTPEGARIVRR